MRVSLVVLFAAIIVAGVAYAVVTGYPSGAGKSEAATTLQSGPVTLANGTYVDYEVDTTNDSMGRVLTVNLQNPTGAQVPQITLFVLKNTTCFNEWKSGFAPNTPTSTTHGALLDARCYMLTQSGTGDYAVDVSGGGTYFVVIENNSPPFPTITLDVLISLAKH